MSDEVRAEVEDGKKIKLKKERERERAGFRVNNVSVCVCSGERDVTSFWNKESRGEL